MSFSCNKKNYYKFLEFPKIDVQKLGGFDSASLLELIPVYCQYNRSTYSIKLINY